MAQTATLTVNKTLSDFGHGTRVVRGTMQLAGTYATPGPTLDLTTLPGFPVAKTASAIVRFFPPPIFDYKHAWTPSGGNLASGTVQSFVVSTGLEVADGAYPGDCEDPIEFEIIFPKF